MYRREKNGPMYVCCKIIKAHQMFTPVEQDDRFLHKITLTSLNSEANNNIFKELFLIL